MKKSVLLILSIIISLSLVFANLGEAFDELKGRFVTRDEWSLFAVDISKKLETLESVNEVKVWREAQYQAYVRDIISSERLEEMKKNPVESSILDSMSRRREEEYGSPTIEPPTTTLLYKMAIISDEHVPSSYSYSKANTEVALANLKNSYNCSFIISCGDHTGNGSESQWNEWLGVVDASPWSRSDIHSCTGNHEVYDHTQVTTLLNRFKQYDNAGKYNSSSAKPYFYEDIGGDRFIFMALEGGGDTPDIRDEFTDAQLTFVQNAINSYTGTGFVWIVEHSLFKGWGSGDNPSRVAYSGGLVASSTYPGNLKFKNLLIANPNCIFVHGHTHFQFEDRDNGRGLLVYAPPGLGLNEGGCHSIHVPSLGSMTRISSSWTKEGYAAAGRSECWIVEAYSDGTRKFKGVNPYTVTDISGMTYTVTK